MMFRPYPVLTAAAVGVLAFLLWLGFWQVQRAEWKSKLISEYERMASAAPRSAGSVFCSDAALTPVGRPVSGADVRAHVIEPKAPMVRMFGHSSAGEAGWRLLAAGHAPDCLAPAGALLVEVGFERLDHTVISYADAGRVPERFLVEAWPTKSAFAPPNAPTDNDWHWFDPAAMAPALNVPKLNNRYYLSVVSGLPDELASVPPSRHVGYAVTWFGMAAAFVVIYGVFHMRAGRLSFGRRDSSNV